MKKYKEPVINRTITTTELEVICLSPDDEKLAIKVTTLFNAERFTDAALLEYLSKNGMPSIVKIKSRTVYAAKYTMTAENFIKYADNKEEIKNAGRLQCNNHRIHERIISERKNQSEKINVTRR